MPVTINNVNNGTIGANGDPDNCTVDQLNNSAFFVDNTDGINIEYDGYTVPLVAVIAVVPGTQYTIKLVIADVGDGVLDSGVFLEGQSFVSVDCDAGEVAFVDTDAETVEFCIDNVPSVINLVNTSAGSNDTYRYVVTNSEGLILSMHTTGNIESGEWTVGTYHIDGISYSGNLIGLDEGASIGDISADGCFEMDGPLTVDIDECESEFDCPNLSANIGDTCDDGDETTENDVVTVDCECEGTPIVVEYDCPDLEANIGDPCVIDNGTPGILADGTQGIINPNCECVPIEIPECQEFVYFLADHAAADGISDIYQVTLGGGMATMDYIATSEIEVHIAYRASDKLIYAVSKHENSYRTLDPTDGTWGPVVA